MSTYEELYSHIDHLINEGIDTDVILAEVISAVEKWGGGSVHDEKAVLDMIKASPLTPTGTTK